MVEYVDAVEDLDEEMGEEELAKFKSHYALRNDDP